MNLWNRCDNFEFDKYYLLDAKYHVGKFSSGDPLKQLYAS